MHADAWCMLETWHHPRWLFTALTLQRSAVLSVTVLCCAVCHYAALCCLSRTSTSVAPLLRPRVPYRSSMGPGMMLAAGVPDVCGGDLEGDVSQ
jgi:hypothetical protein